MSTRVGVRSRRRRRRTSVGASWRLRRRSVRRLWTTYSRSSRQSGPRCVHRLVQHHARVYGVYGSLTLRLP